MAQRQQFVCIALSSDTFEVTRSLHQDAHGSDSVGFIMTKTGHEYSVWLDREQALRLRDHIDELFGGPLTQAVAALSKKVREGG